MNPITNQINSFNKCFERLKDKNHNKLFLFVDYLFSAFRYGASASDYFDYAFYEKRNSVKKQYACWKFKMHFFHLVNDYSKSSIFNDKAKFLKAFSKYTQRDWLDTRECTLDSFMDFCSRHDEFISKPMNMSCGRGVQKLKISENPEQQFNQLKKDSVLIEEVVIQHHKMCELNPTSVNTVRVATILTGNAVNILGTFVRCGIDNSAVDNLGSGGLLAKIDPETGIVVSDAINNRNEHFVKHPTTGTMFHGFQIPNWEKVLQTVNAAAKEIEGVRYVGWDVAILEDDVTLIEGNFEGMLVGFQAPTNEGIKQKIKDILNQ